MAKKMKLCMQCKNWTDEQVRDCPKCGSILLETPLTDIFWGKITDEEKEQYTKRYMNGGDYVAEEIKKPEGVVYYLEGYNGQLYVYEDKIVIERKGVFGVLSHGMAGSKTIPISSIQNIQLKKAGSFFNGFIQFGVLGGVEKHGGISSAVGDENSVVFLPECNDTASKIKEYIENEIVSRNAKNTGTIQSQFSAADEIMKLKNLLDMGVLTQEEFDAKKKQLLSL